MKYTATYHGKSVGSRTSKRTYTHAVVVMANPATWADAVAQGVWVKDADGTGVRAWVLSWAGSPALADKAVKTARASGFYTMVCAVPAEDAHKAEKVRADAIRKLARKVTDVDVVDADAVVSEGDDNGAYVAAWVWVDFSGTEFDKGE